MKLNETDMNQQQEPMEQYSQHITSPYKVVLYDQRFNIGFNEKVNCQSLLEAVDIATEYVNGTMEDEYGFAYEGAGIYGLQENKWLRVYGNFPNAKATEQAAQCIAEELQQTEDRYTFYQYHFGANRIGTPLAVDNYQEVYSGALLQETTLEYLFYIFNVDPPDDYKGHSMSAGDLIVLHRDGKDAAYYCDRTGWREVPEFLEEKQPEDRYTIYQVKREDFLDFGFLGYDEISKLGRQFSSDHYREVYSGKLSPNTTLDDLYKQFNVNRPADFTGHSLAMSDVVVLHRKGKDAAYYCDSFGWIEVPKFLEGSTPVLKLQDAKEKSQHQEINR